MTREFPVLPLGKTNNHILFDSGAKRVLVDTGTGARLSYLSRKVAAWAELQEVGQTWDFWPPYGNFETPVFHCTLELGNWKTEIPVGILPVEVDRGLFHSADAVIGVDLLKLGAMTFSLRAGHLFADWSCETTKSADRGWGCRIPSSRCMA